MNRIPRKLRAEMEKDPQYKTCIRRDILKDHECEPDPLSGKLIEWEHALTFAGQQVQEKFAILPICWLVHRGPLLNKQINIRIALSRATPDELKKYERADWAKQARPKPFQ